MTLCLTILYVDTAVLHVASREIYTRFVKDWKRNCDRAKCRLMLSVARLHYYFVCYQFLKRILTG